VANVLIDEMGRSDIRQRPVYSSSISTNFCRAYQSAHLRWPIRRVQNYATQFAVSSQYEVGGGLRRVQKVAEKINQQRTTSWSPGGRLIKPSSQLVISTELTEISTRLCSNFSALTLLVGRQEGHPACKKTEWWGAGVVICLERGADFQMAQLMPLRLTVSCCTKIQIGFTFLVPADLGSPGKGAVKPVCVMLKLCYFNQLQFGVQLAVDLLSIYSENRVDLLWVCSRQLLLARSVVADLL